MTGRSVRVRFPTRVALIRGSFVAGFLHEGNLVASVTQGRSFPGAGRGRLPFFEAQGSRLEEKIIPLHK